MKDAVSPATSRRPLGSAIERLIARYPSLAGCASDVELAVGILANSIRDGGKVLVCGNGGSASESEHFVADLMKSFLRDRPLDAASVEELERVGPLGRDIGAALEGALPALALTSQGAIATAIGNDIGFDLVFAQQVEGLGRPGDTLVAISTSGRSQNVVNAAYVAKARGLRVVALTGTDGADLVALADISIRAPGDAVDEIQELHQPICHAIARALEMEFFGPDSDQVAAGTRHDAQPSRPDET